MDTRSSIVWVIANSKNKIFYYKSGYSSISKDVNCSSPKCSLNSKFRCSLNKDKCLYQNSYDNDINFAFGYLDLNRFVFSDGYLNQVFFDVAITKTGAIYGSPNFNGMMGLGPQPSSLLRSFSRKNSLTALTIFLKVAPN